MGMRGHGENLTTGNRDVQNYEIVIEMLRNGPITLKDVMERLSIQEGSAYSILMNLTFQIPIWNPTIHLYKILEESDFEKYR
ncbi:MAG: hypothetical protein MJ176_03040 [Treponema sp.]|nr:hypothetical protein [Treponema sp.]